MLCRSFRLASVKQKMNDNRLLELSEAFTEQEKAHFPISQKPGKVNPLFLDDRSILSATLKMEVHPNPSLATRV